jgi:hypothetical protein
MKRRKPKRVAKKREQRTTWPQRIIFISCIFAMVGVSGLFQSDVALPRCALGAVPGVVSNTQLNGELVHSGKKFLIDVGDRQEHILAKCANQSCSGLYKLLKRENIGTAAHAEFCGPFLTLLLLNHQLVYTHPPPTQADINGDANVRWNIGLFSFIYLIAVALYLTRLFVKKRRASVAKS